MKKRFVTSALAALMGVCMAFGFAGCKQECEHTYDNACDATCNKCSETREVGAHVPEADDGNCLTARNCTACEQVAVTASYTEHTDTDADWTCDNLGCEQLIPGTLNGLVFTPNKDNASYSVTGITADFEGTELTIPATVKGKPVTAIGDFAFSKYIGSTSAVNSVCAALTSVTIPDSVETIGEYVFQNCEALESVTLGENSRLTTIGRQAFSGCKSLTSVTLPDSVTFIGLCAFNNSAVTSIYYEGTESAWAEVEVEDYAIPDNTTVYYYSSDMPTTAGNYWHYDADGVPTTKWDD